MNAFIRIVVGFLLVAHGLVHLLYLAPDVKEFSLEKSRLVSGSSGHSVGGVTMAVTVAAFTLLGLAVWGVPGLATIWPALAIISAVSSLALLFTFWDPHLIFGVALDVALIVVAVIRPECAQQAS